MLFSSADFPGAISDHLVATADAADEHADELQKLVDAWYLTLDWIAANPDEATAIMAEKAEVSPEEYEAFAEGTTLFDAEQALDSFEDRADDPTSLPEMARRINPFLVESGLTEQEADLTDLFVPELHRGLRRERRRLSCVVRAGERGGRRSRRRRGRAPSAAATRAGAARRPGRRGAAASTRSLRIRSPLSLRLAHRRSASIGVAALFAALGAAVVARSTTRTSFLVPSPAATWDALRRDVARRHARRATSWRRCRGSASATAISVAIGIVLGIADRHASSSAEAFFEPQIGFLRYIPASALTPLLLLWLGIGESPKITLIVVGTVFYNILMIADVARAVPRELLNASATLGRRPVDDGAAGDPAALACPGIIDVARINLAAAWLMLVVAELLAAQEGLAFRIVRAQRFRAVDTMFALLIVFGVIGLVSDLLLRRLRSVVARWARP